MGYLSGEKNLNKEYGFGEKISAGRDYLGGRESRNLTDRYNGGRASLEKSERSDYFEAQDRITKLSKELEIMKEKSDILSKELALKGRFKSATSTDSNKLMNSLTSRMQRIAIGLGVGGAIGLRIMGGPLGLVVGSIINPKQASQISCGEGEKCGD